ncbi:MAG: GNAT family N-acetyltransferase [Planctomycetes bacterium]|nr:GNAT family N-acetyltransferase [Planctomycetota bacterium]
MSPEPAAQTPPVTFAVHACSRDDREEQARLFNQCFKKAVTAANLHWRYDENPHGASVSFVTRPAGGEGVSGYACSPRRALSFGDERTLAPVGETGDVMTHPEWRKRGLFSDLDRAAMAATKHLGWPCVFGLPNRRSAHIFVELGWEVIGSVRPWTFVLRTDAAARRELAVDGRARAWLAPFTARTCRGARRRRAVLGDGLRTLPLARFPRDVEALARTVEKRFAFMIRRDAEYLNWRFANSPSKLHRIVGVYDGAERFAGYVVVQVPRPGEPVGYLVDVLAHDERALAAALETGIATLESAGASLVRATAIDGSWWQRVLVDVGFRAPKPENHLTVILHPHQTDHPLVKAARDVRGWYFTDGDRDDETMG